MENQPAGEGHREESYVLHCPCKFIDQLIKDFLKCLGFHADDSSSACPKSDKKQHLDDPTPADNNETQMKSTEDEKFKALGARRPSAPSTTTGPPGGQINVVSPS